MSKIKIYKRPTEGVKIYKRPQADDVAVQEAPQASFEQPETQSSLDSLSSVINEKNRLYDIQEKSIIPLSEEDLGNKNKVATYNENIKLLNSMRPTDEIEQFNAMRQSVVNPLGLPEDVAERNLKFNFPADTTAPISQEEFDKPLIPIDKEILGLSTESPAARILSSVGQGVLGLGEGTAGVVEYMGNILGSEWLETQGKETGDAISQFTQSFAPDDPNFAEQLASGVGSMIAFGGVGIGVGAGVVKGAKALSKLAPKLAKALPKNLAKWSILGAMTGTESLQEAGSVYRESRQSGATKEESARSAEKTMVANAILIGVTNKFGILGDKVAGIKKALISAPLEAIQEAGQSIISALSQGKEVDWDEVVTSAQIGGIIGGGASVALDKGVAPKEVKEPITIKPKEEAKVVPKVEPKPQEDIVKKEIEIGGVTQEEFEATAPKEVKKEVEDAKPQEKVTETAPTRAVEPRKETKEIEGVGDIGSVESEEVVKKDVPTARGLKKLDKQGADLYENNKSLINDIFDSREIARSKDASPSEKGRATRNARQLAKQVPGLEFGFDKNVYLTGKKLFPAQEKAEKVDIAEYKDYKPRNRPEEITTMAEYISYHSDSFPNGFGTSKIDKGIADLKSGTESNEANVVRSVSDDFIDEIGKAGTVEVPISTTQTAPMSIAEFREEVNLRKLAEKEGVTNGEITETINRPTEDIEKFAEDITRKAEATTEAEINKNLEEVSNFFKSKVFEKAAEVGELQKTIKKKQMVFDIEAKEDLSISRKLPLDTYYNLPFEEWSKTKSEAKEEFQAIGEKQRAEEKQPTTEKTPAGEQFTLGAETKISFPTKAKFEGKVDKSEDTPLFKQEKKDKGQSELFQKAETERDLIAMHNLSADNLANVDKIGGLAMPSLAIAHKERGFDSFGEISLIANKDLIDPRKSRKVEAGAADIYSARYPSVTYTPSNKVVQALEKEMDEAFGDDLDRSRFGYSAVIRGDFENKGLEELKRSELIALKYLKDTGELKKTVREGKKGKISISETLSANKFDRESPEFQDYIDGIYDRLDVKEKIFKGYTPSGGRRYVAHTLENAIKEMKKDKGETFFYGAGSVRGAITPRFKSIDDIKSKKNRIVSSEDFSKIKDEVNDGLVELADKMSPYYKYDSDRFGYYEEAGEGLVEFAKRGRSQDFENIPKDVQSDIEAYLKKLKNLPTEYFEAKINRAVDVSEFEGALVPEDVSKKSLDILKKNGITNIKTYKDEADRKTKLQEFDDLLFQKKSTQPISKLTKPELDKELGLVNKLLPGDVKVTLDDKLVDSQGKPARASFDFNTNTVKVNPKLADKTSVMHEISHKATEIVLLENSGRGKALLKLNGWDGKSDPMDLSNPNVVEAWEGIGTKAESYFTDEKKFMEEEPRAKWYKQAFDKLKQFWESLSSWFKGKGFASESKFFDDLAKGNFKKAKESGLMEKLQPAFQKLFQKAGKPQPTKKPSAIGKTLRDIGTPIIHKVNRLSRKYPSMKKLGDALSKMEFDISVKTDARAQKVSPLLKFNKSLPEDKKEKWDLLRKNADTKDIQKFIIENNIGKEYSQVRAVLDEMFKESNEVGLDVGYTKSYHPRKVKDLEGFLNYINEDKALKDLVDDKLTKQENADKIANMLRGYGGGISLSKTSNLKDRGIERVTKELNEFYHTSDDALMMYVDEVTNRIEERKFFSKKAKPKLNEELVNIRDLSTKSRKLRAKALETRENEDWAKFHAVKNELVKARKDSKVYQDRLKTRKLKLAAENKLLKNIGDPQLTEQEIDKLNEQVGIPKVTEEDINEYVGGISDVLIDAIDENELTYTDMQELKGILRGRFLQNNLPKSVAQLKQLTYVATIGDIYNTATQLEDMAWSMYAYGFKNATKAMGKSLIGQGVRAGDVGINSLAYEMKDNGKVGKAVNKMFKLTGFTAIDMFGKATSLTASLLHKKSLLKKNDPKAIAELERIFEDKADQVKEDIINENWTDETKYLAFSSLMQNQPITPSSMPTKYNESSLGKLAYTLKTFALSRMNAVVNDIIDSGEGKSKTGKAINTAAKLSKLAFYGALAGAGADMIKSLLTGDFDEWEALIEDPFTSSLAKYYLTGLFRGSGLNKWNVEAFFKASDKVKGFGQIPLKMGEDFFGVPAPLSVPLRVIEDVVFKDVSNWMDEEQSYRFSKYIPIVGKTLHRGFLKTDKDGNFIGGYSDDQSPLKDEISKVAKILKEFKDDKDPKGYKKFKRENKLARWLDKSYFGKTNKSLINDMLYLDKRYDQLSTKDQELLDKTKESMEMARENFTRIKMHPRLMRLKQRILKDKSKENKLYK